LASRTAVTTAAGQNNSATRTIPNFCLAALTSANPTPTIPTVPTKANTPPLTSSASVTQAERPTRAIAARQAATIIASIDLRPSFSQ